MMPTNNKNLELNIVKILIRLFRFVLYLDYLFRFI